MALFYAASVLLGGKGEATVMKTMPVGAFAGFLQPPSPQNRAKTPVQLTVNLFRERFETGK